MDRRSISRPGSTVEHSRRHLAHDLGGLRGYCHDPWRYRPVYVDNNGPGIGHQPSMATQMPEMGMPGYDDMNIGDLDF